MSVEVMRAEDPISQHPKHNLESFFYMSAWSTRCLQPRQSKRIWSSTNHFPLMTGSHMISPSSRLWMQRWPRCCILRNLSSRNSTPTLTIWRTACTPCVMLSLQMDIGITLLNITQCSKSFGTHMMASMMRVLHTPAHHIKCLWARELPQINVRSQILLSILHIQPVLRSLNLALWV